MEKTAAISPSDDQQKDVTNNKADLEGISKEIYSITETLHDKLKFVCNEELKELNSCAENKDLGHKSELMRYLYFNINIELCKSIKSITKIILNLDEPLSFLPTDPSSVDLASEKEKDLIDASYEASDLCNVVVCINDNINILNERVNLLISKILCYLPINYESKISHDEKDQSKKSLSSSPSSPLGIWLSEKALDLEKILSLLNNINRDLCF